MTVRLALMPEPPVRRDKRGRRIGRNWWREMNCDELFWATAAWEREAEEVALGYATELMEFSAEHPRPTLKEFLIRNKGMASYQVEQTG